MEISRHELPLALNLDMLDRITMRLRALGFHYVTLDTEGYRSGSMNHNLPEILPASAIRAAAVKH